MSMEKSKIGKAGLEHICALYLRQRPDGRAIERVRIAARANPVRNWFVAEIEPSLPIASEADDGGSRGRGRAGCRKGHPARL